MSHLILFKIKATLLKLIFSKITKLPLQFPHKPMLPNTSTDFVINKKQSPTIMLQHCAESRCLRFEPHRKCKSGNIGIMSIGLERAEGLARSTSF